MTLVPFCTGPPVPDTIIQTLATLANRALLGLSGARIMKQVMVEYDESAAIILKAGHCLELRSGTFVQVIAPLVLNESVHFVVYPFEFASSEDHDHPEMKLPWLARMVLDGDDGFTLVSSSEVQQRRLLD